MAKSRESYSYVDFIIEKKYNNNMSKKDKVITRLALLMHKKSVTQTELAEACGVSQAKISHISSGVDKTPDLSTLEKIADYLDFAEDLSKLLEDVSSLV